MSFRAQLHRIGFLFFLFVFILPFAQVTPAQQKERTLDEIKAEAIKRAENGMYPLIGLDPADVKEAFAAIKTSDYDEWAAAFSGVADRYMTQAKAAEANDSARASALYVKAWRLYSFGRWPVPISPGKQRAYAKALDAFLAHARLMDPPLEVVRIPFEGSEIVAYWATKLAILEHSRLKAVVAQSPPADATFQKDFVINKTLGNREYLFGLGPALMSIYEGAKMVDDLATIVPKMSLVRQGLLGKPTAPMLIIAGVLDTQVPISDAYLILSSGDVPKEAWINPQGGHLGRQVKVWPDPVIFRQVIIPYLVRTLEVPSAK